MDGARISPIEVTNNPNVFIAFNEQLTATVSGQPKSYVIRFSNGSTWLQRLRWRSGQGKKEILDGTFYASCSDCQVPAYNNNPNVLNCKCQKMDGTQNPVASCYLPRARQNGNLKKIWNDNGNLIC